MEEIINMSVNKMIIDPHILANQGDNAQTVDPSDMPRGSLQHKNAPSRELGNYDIPLNLTFTETSLNHNLDE